MEEACVVSKRSMSSFTIATPSSSLVPFFSRPSGIVAGENSSRGAPPKRQPKPCRGFWAADLTTGYKKRSYAVRKEGPSAPGSSCARGLIMLEYSRCASVRAMLLRAYEEDQRWCCLGYGGSTRCLGV